MNSKLYIVVFILYQMQYVVYSSAPPIYYESYGANQVVRDEGAPVLTPSGAKFVTGVTKEECGRLCWRQDKCKCCNAFTYQSTSQRCYLKNRFDDAIDMNYTDPDGFQTFKYFPISGAPVYDGDLPEVFFLLGGQPYFVPFQSWYTTKGENKNAQNEGQQIIADGSPSMRTNLTAAECATACESILECEGFSYNPNQDGGKCYFKTQIPKDSKYITTVSEDGCNGWSFYWKESSADKCYCSCKSQFTCLHCYQGKCCEIDGKLTC